MKKVFGRLSSGFRSAHRTYKSCLNFFFIYEFDPPGHPPFIKHIKNRRFFQGGFPKSLLLSYNKFSKKFSSPGMLHISTPQLYLFWSTLYKAKFWDFHSMIHDILNVQVWSQMGIKFVTSACNTQSIARLNEKIHKIINLCCHTRCFLMPPPLKSQNTKKIRVS